MESAELETLIIDAADNGVVTITMNRPKRLNAASPQMFTELRETWNEIGGDPTVRCVVMTGAGDAFCSGADLAADGGDGPRRHALQGLNVIHQTVSALYSIMVPVIAKVNGVAAGAGMNLALACDLIVASDQARFSEIFARRALAPARVAKVIPDQGRQVITAIVDEDQLSLAIGRNGQNVRLASQLIGWQIDLYGSREWLERGADTSLFLEDETDSYETANFPLSELSLDGATLTALSEAGYHSFLDIIDLDRADFLAVDGVSEAAAGQLLALIEDLTVVDSESVQAGEEAAVPKGEPG